MYSSSMFSHSNLNNCFRFPKSYRRCSSWSDGSKYWSSSICWGPWWSSSPLVYGPIWRSRTIACCSWMLKVPMHGYNNILITRSHETSVIKRKMFILKKTHENINKNRKDVAVMLCCSPWSNHADVKKHSTQNKQKNTRKQKQKQKICCSNALALTLVQPCRCPILFLSCSQSQCCLSAGEKVSLFVGQWKTKKWREKK